MSLKNSLKCLFIGLSIFSVTGLKANVDSSALNQENLLEGFKAHHHNDKHHHQKVKDVVDLFFLADFRFSASQFAASSTERTFDVWGGAASASQTISNDVISGFTIANAVSAGVASNETLECGEILDFVGAWTAFAEADIAQTNSPNVVLDTVQLIAAAAAVGKLYDQCIAIKDHKFIGRIHDKLTAITSNFSPNLKSGELFQKIQSFSDDSIDIPVFEILFGLYGLARSGTNYTAFVAHGVADTDAAAAAIIYIDSQILSEASFLIMDLITLTITLIDFIEHDDHHHSDSSSSRSHSSHSRSHSHRHSHSHSHSH